MRSAVAAVNDGLHTALFVLAVAAASGCGGSGGTPTAPSSSTVTGGTTGTGTASVTIQIAAPALGRQLGQFTMNALREVSAQSVPTAWAPSGASGKMATFTGSYRADCPDGGSREMINLPTNLPFIGQVDLSSVVQVYSSCAFTDGGNRLTANGRVSMRGTYWKAERADQDVRLQGPITLSPLAGDQQIDGRIGQDGAYTGSITGVNVITGPTAPLPPPPVSAAQLLAGNWQGRYVSTCTTENAVIGRMTCEYTWDLAAQLAAAGNGVAGNLTSTSVRATGSRAECSEAFPTGRSARQAVNGNPNNGTITLNGAQGTQLSGNYNTSGTWMGGRMVENVAGASCTTDWQMIQ